MQEVSRALPTSLQEPAVSLKATTRIYAGQSASRTTFHRRWRVRSAQNAVDGKGARSNRLDFFAHLLLLLLHSLTPPSPRRMPLLSTQRNNSAATRRFTQAHRALMAMLTGAQMRQLVQMSKRSVCAAPERFSGRSGVSDADWPCARSTVRATIDATRGGVADEYVGASSWALFAPNSALARFTLKPN